ncbi:hypothetical protein B5E77_14230 [Lachnoclostridium sp. An131]|uniref:hypothetical protein n=1 Tax=Lachnoclostridium sp. An131 TaxID=1965555 RepID=UPI000B39547A|nr:hypothetical protein [Lachnoclostridium sp. An131]OUQ24048.1 hypothetical protein B5E77_14230 [Lachnoclostridium sp. An131]
MTQKKQVLCGLQGIFRLFNCQTPGWKALSAKETGRIGGLMTKKKKEIKEKLRRTEEEQEGLMEELL